jgi:hypothetical protein
MALRSPSKQHDILRNGQDMTPKDRRHLRDEAGSLFAAFELGGAEELTVVSGGTAMAALVRGQSHTLSTTMLSSRDIGSLQTLFGANKLCLWRQVAVACSHCRLEFTRAGCDSLPNSTPAEPRKRRRCAPPSTHTTCHHQLNPNTYIVPHYTHFLILSRHTVQR